MKLHLAEVNPDSIQLQIRSLVETLNQLQQERMRECDLTVSQLRAVVAVGEHPELPVGAVGKALGIGLPSSSLLIDRLVKAGLVARHRPPEDRRTSLCSLTESGQDLYQAVTFGARQLHLWLTRMTNDDLNALARGLDALARAAEGSILEEEART